MSWLTRLLAHIRKPQPDPKTVRAVSVIRAADRVLEDYRRQDAALKLVRVKR